MLRDSGQLGEEELTLKQVFAAHWQDESWHEVLRLITGMIDSKFAGEIIKFLIEKEDKSRKFGNLLIAAKCLSEVRNRTAIEDISTKLLNEMKIVVETQYKKELGEDFLYTIASVWKEISTTFDWLKKQVKNHSNYLIRANALQAIAKVFKNDFVLQLLKDSAQFDKTATVRKIAVDNILKIWINDDNILPFILNIAQNEQKFLVISSILNSLIHNKDKTTAFLVLKTCLIYNNYLDVFVGAFNELIRN